MSSTHTVPLRGARIATLALAWMWAVVGGSVGLNALIKSKDQQSTLKRIALPTVVTINVNGTPPLRPACAAA